MPLQHAQELGLDAEAHLADLVEHQRAAVGRLELADLAVRGARESPALVAEQLAGQQVLGQRGAIEAHEGPLAARAGEVHGAGHELLAHPALAADQERGLAGGGAGDLLGDLPDQRAAADDLALHAQTLAQLHVLVADLHEVLGQFLLPVEVREGHGHGVGDRQREFEVLGVRHAIGLGGIEVDQPEHLLAAADRGADHARGGDLPLAVAAAHGAVAQNVAGEDGLTLAHHRVGQKIRHAVVAALGTGARGDQDQVGGHGRAVIIAGQEQHRAGVDARALEQPAQGHLGHLGHVRGPGKVEGQPAELGGRLADLGDRAGGLLGGLKEAGLAAAVHDRRRLVVAEHVRLLLDDRIDGVLVGSALLAPHDRRGLGEGLAEAVDKDQLGAADADDLARQKQAIALDQFLAHYRPVAALQVADCPLVSGEEKFRMVAAATVVFEHDLVGGGAANGHRLARNQPEHVGPLGPLANHQVSDIGHD